MNFYVSSAICNFLQQLFFLLMNKQFDIGKASNRKILIRYNFNDIPIFTIILQSIYIFIYIFSFYFNVQTVDRKSLRCIHVFRIGQNLNSTFLRIILTCTVCFYQKNICMLMTAFRITQNILQYIMTADFLRYMFLVSSYHIVDNVRRYS